MNKKIFLLIQLFFLSYFSISQTSKTVKEVESATDNFIKIMPQNTIINLIDSSKLYRLDAKFTTGQDMNDVFTSGNYTEYTPDFNFSSTSDSTLTAFGELKFENKSISINVNGGYWAHLTSSGNLWSIQDTINIYESGDTIFINGITGQYVAIMNLSFKVLSNDLWAIRLRSKSDSTTPGLIQGPDTTIKTNLTSVGILNITNDDYIIPEIINNSSNDDPDINAGSIVLYKLRATAITQTATNTYNSYTNDIYQKYDYLFSYGVKYQVNSPSPILTTVGIDAHHTELKTHNQIRAATIKNNGTVNYYLADTNFNFKYNSSDSSKLDGSDGQVMIIFPEHYRREYIESGYRYIMISQYPLENYTRIDSFAISVYSGSLSTGDTLCSISGDTAITSKSRTSFRAYAAKRGTDWTILTYECYKTLVYLYLIEYASFNSQDSLGTGATNASSANWNAYNGYNPIFINGKINKYGIYSGSFLDTIPAFPSGTDTLFTQRACYRGVEDIFGHIWQWVDGVNVYNAGGGGSRVFTCYNPSNFSDTDSTTNYTYVGKAAELDGYIKEIITNEIIPSDVGGSSTTYKTDYYYTYYDDNSASGWRAVLVGGALSSGASAGLLCSYSDYSAGGSGASVGSRLCLIWTY